MARFLREEEDESEIEVAALPVKVLNENQQQEVKREAPKKVASSDPMDEIVNQLKELCCLSCNMVLLVGLAFESLQLV